MAARARRRSPSWNGPAASTTAKAPVCRIASEVTLRTSNATKLTRAAVSASAPDGATKRLRSRPATTTSNGVVRSSRSTSRRPNAPVPPTTRTRHGATRLSDTDAVAGAVRGFVEDVPLQFRAWHQTRLRTPKEAIAVARYAVVQPIADGSWNGEQHARPPPAGQSAKDL